MAIFLLHGIVDEYVRDASAYRNYVPREMFETYLRSRRAPFAAWSADGRSGDVLTVDDATRGGGDACMCARRLGHEVMFFVNPFQIATGQPYFFSLLDAVIDARSADSVNYRDEAYDLTDGGEVARFRFAAMRALFVKSAPAAYAEVVELGALLGAADAQVGEHQQPISLGELLALRDAGVRIENHGWSHVEISSLTDAGFAEHVGAGREWLRREASVQANLYAVPFGATDVPLHLRDWVADGYFLAGERFPRGRLNPQGWNRRDLAMEMRALNRLRAYIDARRGREPGTGA
jgi:hypothetical protein